MEEEIQKSEDYNQDVGVEDELGQLTKEQMIDNLNEDVKSYTKSLETANNNLKNFKDQWEVDKGVYDIMQKEGNYRKISPVMVYEEDPKYWELQAQKLAYKVRMDSHMAEATLKKYEVQIEDTQRALDSAKEKLELFKGN